MRAGLIVSVTVHLAILAWGVIALISPRALDSQIEALPVDLVKLDDTTDLAKGLTTAAVPKKPSPNDPAKTADEAAADAAEAGRQAGCRNTAAPTATRCSKGGAAQAATADPCGATPAHGSPG